MARVRNFTTLTTDLVWRDAAGGVRTDIGYAFAAAVPDHQRVAGTDAFIASFRPLDPAEQAVARGAFAAWEAASALTFTEVAPGAADIVVGVYEFDFDPEVADAFGFAFPPDTVDPLGGDVFIDRDSASEPDLYLHEIGHALGLKHPFDPPRLLADGLDIRANTVMGASDLMGGPPGVFDVAAIQALYGPPTAPPPGLTGGAGADALRGDAGDDGILGLGGADLIRGARGDDVISAGRGRDTVLGGAGADAVDGGGGRDRIAGGRGDDQLAGGGGRDTLLGGGGDDTLIGGRGGDSLKGGGGGDSFVFLQRGGLDRIADFEFPRDFILIEGLEAFDDLVIADTAAGALILFEGFRILVEDAAADRFSDIDFGL